MARRGIDIGRACPEIPGTIETNALRTSLPVSFAHAFMQLCGINWLSVEIRILYANFVEKSNNRLTMMI